MLEDKRNSKKKEKKKIKELIKYKESIHCNKVKKETITKIIIDENDDYVHNHKFF
jgi:hypothetical protein